MTSPELIALRTVYWSLSEGSFPPEAERTPADEARIVALFVLQELLRILDEFSDACLRGERCHLVVNDTEREPDHVIIDLRLVFEHDRSPRQGSETTSSFFEHGRSPGRTLRWKARDRGGAGERSSSAPVSARDDKGQPAA